VPRLRRGLHLRLALRLRRVQHWIQVQQVLRKLRELPAQPSRQS